MWICLKDAFLSVVHKDCEPDELLVRARRPGDIESVFPGAVVHRTPSHDYLFRATVKREHVAAEMRDIVMAYSADNFKNSVLDDTLHTAYSRVWGVMSSLQPSPPYGRVSGGQKSLYGSEL